MSIWASARYVWGTPLVFLTYGITLTTSDGGGGRQAV
jgi:hypothetical protein